MKLDIYQIDAFADRQFEGNPAAVCPLKKWLPDEVMQDIAQENNLSETAFFIPENSGFHIRWFTPNKEVDLCGHATLASAYVIFNILKYEKKKLEFNSRSGILTVIQNDKSLTLDFPSQKILACETPDPILNAFKIRPVECFKSTDYIAIFENEDDVKSVSPDMVELKKLDLRGVIISSKSTKYDFVARMFAPNFGIEEDPVTGSAYTQLVPYWVSKLGKKQFHAKQVSERGGELFCELVNDRIHISGKCVKYLQGIIEIK